VKLEHLAPESSTATRCAKVASNNIAAGFFPPATTEHALHGKTDGELCVGEEEAHPHTHSPSCAFLLSPLQVWSSRTCSVFTTLWLWLLSSEGHPPPLAATAAAL
jgi:hypothetical protein